jgi:hypothetical protein
MLLVPTKQFESFLETINRNLGVHLRIPSGPANSSGFRVAFPNEGTPRPRYLGRAMNKDMADRLHADIPSSKYALDTYSANIIQQLYFPLLLNKEYRKTWLPYGLNCLCCTR